MQTNTVRQATDPDQAQAQSQPAVVPACEAKLLAIQTNPSDATNSANFKSGAYYDGVPDYMVDVYDWCYVNPSRARLLDRNLVVTTLLFLQDQRLMRSVIKRLAPGMRLWMVAHVYGDLVTRMAKTVGPQGKLDLTDVTPVQAEHARTKLQACPWASVYRTDAATFNAATSPYDMVCSFMLMHEVPDQKKREVIDNMLANLAPQGKAIFVDYHRPAWWQPIRWILKAVNHYLEPYANALWQHEISEFATAASAFRWKKTTFFGGVYQMVEVSRLDESSKAE